MSKLKNIIPLENLTLVDKVEIRLKEYFKENNLKIGDPIPKELEFADALGVSRTVIREALLRLRTIGVIESKKRKGMILTQPDIIQNFEKAIEYNLLEEETLIEIFELRLILEMGMADLLFARKTPEDIEELNKIVEKQEKDEVNTTVFSLKHEIQFHGKLYQMANNSTLQRFQDLLLVVFNYAHDHLTPEDVNFKYSKGSFVSHRDLLNILETGTPKEFREAMRVHLEPHFEKVINYQINK